MKLIKLEDVTPEILDNLKFNELTPEELAEAYRLGRESFTAADLQKYTELDEGVSAEEFVRELEEVQQKFDSRSG